jgi:hypothetical protein
MVRGVARYDLPHLDAIEQSVSSRSEKKADHKDNDEDINKGELTKQVILVSEHDSGNARLSVVHHIRRVSGQCGPPVTLSRVIAR